MGNQQNPDGIYIPPGVNRRFPLNRPQDQKPDDARPDESKRSK
ncbi:hypothetical protein PBI_DAMIEN_65 [Mycobacterium phage Damien]|uniref:Uncharacterized protein n=1 Tax=Mycobacterium phage Konstantine TaxID=563121 RepID=B5U539_9CAUD|nr:gp69 [Mycobacterium phage Konstantine]YP_009044054.1 hypothetical protein HL12_gp65 [Mycobacterium phage Damien]AXH47190.1 hypothetical protein SEA_CBORCH11_67 [Mycobacterium phage Cborch11]QLF83949.1 hypothetical protein SEA_BECKERTON_64 [Mycobacterium phage Beckerton]ACI12485.1 hypothetical protein KONSTANTINE_69 [Mycobacterium phage Konstantine]AHZ95426.1 hypothetical protein PBI_DAMIEN_65 [Mycobacterium phage Damien]